MCFFFFSSTQTTNSFFAHLTIYNISFKDFISYFTSVYIHCLYRHKLSSSQRQRRASCDKQKAMDLIIDALEDLTRGIIPLGKAPFTVHYPSNLSLALYLAMYLGQISKAQNCVLTLKDVSKSLCAQHRPLTPIHESTQKSLHKPERTHRHTLRNCNAHYHRFCLKASKLPTKYLNHCHACKILLFLLNVINPSPRS